MGLLVLHHNISSCKDILALHFTEVLSETDWHKNQQKVINEEELKFCAGIYFFQLSFAWAWRACSHVAQQISDERSQIAEFLAW